MFTKQWICWMSDRKKLLCAKVHTASWLSDKWQTECVEADAFLTKRIYRFVGFLCDATHTHTHTKVFRFSTTLNAVATLHTQRDTHTHTLNTFIPRSLRNDIWLSNVLKRRLSLPNCHTSNVCSFSSSLPHPTFPSRYSLLCTSFSSCLYIFRSRLFSLFLLLLLPFLFVLLLLSGASFHFNVPSSLFYAMSHFEC